MDVRHRDLIVRAADGWALAADLLEPAADAPRAAVLIAPALGVRRGFYRPFATHLAAGGLATLVIDYRGMGDSRPVSLRTFDASLHDWADLDLAAALAWLGARFPGLPRRWFGHSMGGQLLGVLAEPAVDRALLVAAQHGHWRNWPGATRWLMAGLWWGVIPTVARLAGRLPMSALGQGEDVPQHIARQWARWGRDRAYAVGFARGRGDACGFTSYAGALRSDAIIDDRYAPPSTVRPLLEAFTATRGELNVIEPARFGLTRLGHFGGFRSDARALWDDWRAWLGADAAVAPVR